MKGFYCLIDKDWEKGWWCFALKDLGLVWLSLFVLGIVLMFGTMEIHVIPFSVDYFICYLAWLSTGLSSFGWKIQVPCLLAELRVLPVVVFFLLFLFSLFTTIYTQASGMSSTTFKLYKFLPLCWSNHSSVNSWQVLCLGLVLWNKQEFIQVQVSKMPHTISRIVNDCVSNLISGLNIFTTSAII